MGVLEVGRNLFTKKYHCFCLFLQPLHFNLQLQLYIPRTVSKNILLIDFTE